MSEDRKALLHSQLLERFQLILVGITDGNIPLFQKLTHLPHNRGWVQFDIQLLIRTPDVEKILNNLASLVHMADGESKVIVSERRVHAGHIIGPQAIQFNITPSSHQNPIVRATVDDGAGQEVRF